MFNRLFGRRSERKLDDSRAEAVKSRTVVDGLGIVSMNATTSVPEQANPKELLPAQIIEVTGGIDKIYEARINQLAQTMSKDQVQAALIAGWNDGSIPRVANGDVARGNGNSQVRILHGKIPENFFTMFGFGEYDTSSGAVLPEPDSRTGAIKSGSLALRMPDVSLPTAPEPGNTDSFYVETLNLPQPGSRFEDNSHDDAYVQRVVQDLATVQALVNPQQ